MKLKLFSLIFISTFLIACDSATIDGNGTNTGSDNTDNNTDGNDSENDNDAAVATGLDGVTTSMTSNGTVNSVGLIKLEPIGVSADSTRGLFGEFSETLTEQEVRDSYMPPADICIVTLAADENATEATDEFLILDQTATLVSAGESLVLTDDNGTYATLQQTTGLSGPVYQPETELSQSAGANLSIDIPGDQFAAFPGIAVPPVPAFQVVSPANGENVSVDTFFQWVPNDVPGSVIELYTSGFSTASNEAIFISCALVDDGLFGFPEDIQAQMSPGYDDDWTSLLRIAYNVAADGDAMVFVANSVRPE